MSVKLFIRSDKETIERALKSSLPGFLKFYEGYSTPQILTEAYHSIREASTIMNASKLFVDEEYKPNYKILTEDESLDDFKTEGDEVVVKVNLVRSIPVESINIKPTLIETKKEEGRKINKKGTLFSKFKEGKTIKLAVEEIEIETGVKIELSYAKEVFKDFQKL